MEDEHTIEADKQVLVSKTGSPRQGSPVAEPESGEDDERRVVVEGASTERLSFFGIYDGHAGTDASRFLRDNLYGILIEKLQSCGAVDQALKDAILAAESKFQEYAVTKSTDAGSTLAVMLVLNDRLVAANVGDSEIILCRGDGSIEVLSEIHNMSKNPAEETRVLGMGGSVFHKRLGHPCFNVQVVSLAVTRSIGDIFFKQGEYTKNQPSGLVADPFIKEVELKSTDRFAILGCDGLWDVMTYQQACDFVSSQIAAKVAPKELTEKLVAEALQKGSTDNITACVVLFTAA